MSSVASPYTPSDAMPRPSRDYRRMKRSERIDPDHNSNHHEEEKTGSSLRAWLLWRIPAIVMICGLAYFALNQTKNGPTTPQIQEETPLVSPPARWTSVASPAVLFGFDMPELELPTMAVEARTYRDGGREDILSIGTIADPFHLRVIIDRSQKQRSTSFYIDLVRNAANAGLSVKRTAQSSEYPNKFGAFEVAETTLVKSNDAHCLAFRGTGLNGKIALHGWLCGEERFVKNDMLACFIDRLTTTPALREPGIEEALRSLNKTRTAACDSALDRF